MVDLLHCSHMLIGMGLMPYYPAGHIFIPFFFLPRKPYVCFYTLSCLLCGIHNV